MKGRKVAVGMAAVLLLGLTAAVTATGNGPGPAAGDCVEDCDGVPDKDRIQLRTSAPGDPGPANAVTIDEITASGDQESDQDRIRDRDGTCVEDCDGVPDQDRIRLRTSAPGDPGPASAVAVDATDADTTRPQNQEQNQERAGEPEQNQEQNQERAGEPEQNQEQNQEPAGEPEQNQEQNQAGPGPLATPGSGRGS